MNSKRARRTFWTIVAAGALLAAAVGGFFPTKGVLATIARDLEVFVAGIFIFFLAMEMAERLP
jgi:hypothetical protein